MALRATSVKQLHWYNHSARRLLELAEGDPIRMKLPGDQRWTPAVCKCKAVTQTYEVEANGKLYRRNRRQLLK